MCIQIGKGGDHIEGGLTPPSPEGLTSDLGTGMKCRRKLAVEGKGVEAIAASTCRQIRRPKR